MKTNAYVLMVDSKEWLRREQESINQWLEDNPPFDWHNPQAWQARVYGLTVNL